jgi:dTMP kinase
MPARGKFIALEGIDGSGKRTQMELLANELAKRGIAHVRVSFPRYESFFGAMVAQFLNGDFGRLEAVDPHFSALLYACNRLETKPMLQAELAAGKTVLADRYIGSNLAHQTARVTPEKREDFLAWLRKLEYEVYGLPAEDLVVYLRLPAAEAQRLVGTKGARDYTKRQRDLLEADLAHLQTASEIYDRLAREPNWATIECFDLVRQELRAPGVIHQVVMAAVDARAFSIASAR